METLNEFDQNHFYESEHIDRDVLAEKDRSMKILRIGNFWNSIIS